MHLPGRVDSLDPSNIEVLEEFPGRRWTSIIARFGLAASPSQTLYVIGNVSFYGVDCRPRSLAVMTIMLVDPLSDIDPGIAAIHVPLLTTARLEIA